MLRHNQKGAALLEFAIILPFLLVLVFGMIEFGLIAYNKQVITNASREGARWAIGQPSPTKVPLEPKRTTDSVNLVVQDYWTKNRLISFGSGTPTPPISAIIDMASGIPLAATGQNVCAIATSDKDILVQVTYDYEFLVFDSVVQLVGGSQNHTISLSGSTIMRCEAAQP
jgi:Flp pilus assembly protein TadG